MTVQWLAGPDGQAAINALRDADPLTARRLLPELSAEQVTAALTQAKHRPAQFPLPLVTAEGVQMASPVPVARRRAQRLVAQGVTRIIDAGCGIGLDSWAFSEAGLSVVAYEADPYTAQVAEANLAGRDVQVITGDVTRETLPPGTLFVDPARRRAARDVGGQARRIRDPQQWSPPWGWVLQQAAERAVVARVAPGLREVPDHVEWQCSSMGRRLVDASVWFPPLAQTDRRASVDDSECWTELLGPAAPAPVGPAGSFIIDPDPAIVRSGLVGNLALELDGRLLDEHLAFVTTDAAVPSWAGRAMQVEREVPRRTIADHARDLGMTKVTVWSRGFDRPPDVGMPEGRDGVVVLARIGPHRETHCWIGWPQSC